MHIMLSKDNVLHYLTDKQLLSANSIVDGRVMVIEGASRHRSFAVIHKSEPSYFIKQMQPWHPNAALTLMREAGCYALLHNVAALSTFIPKYYSYDKQDHILVLEFLPESENLTEYHRRLSEFPCEVASLMGKALGAFHGAAFSIFKGSDDQMEFAKQIPWILSFHHPNNPATKSLSGGNAQLFSILKQYPEFALALDELRSQWQSRTLIHGDMKWDNFLVASFNDEINLRIIDWETSDIGDPGWDVGAVFQSYIACWVMSIPASPNSEISELAQRAQVPLVQMQDAAKMFWNSYLDSMKIEASRGAELLISYVKYAAARLIQTAYEQMALAPCVTSHSILLLQVSLNILQQPEEALAVLLGL